MPLDIDEALRIERLKQSWYSDPCWDIEDTDGFETHRNELRAYRLECEAEWARERTGRLTAKAEQLGMPGNLTLAAYVERLEERIQAVSDGLSRHVGY